MPSYVINMSSISDIIQRLGDLISDLSHFQPFLKADVAKSRFYPAMTSTDEYDVTAISPESLLSSLQSAKFLEFGYMLRMLNHPTLLKGLQRSQNLASFRIWQTKSYSRWNSPGCSRHLKQPLPQTLISHSQVMT